MVLTLQGTFPISREQRFLTRRNRLEDGTEYRSPEQVAPLYRWDFDVSGLSAAALQALEDQFVSTGGRYGSFIFLDALENLLQWSEDFSQAVWVKSEPAAISIVRDLADPLGGSAAQQLTNTSATANAVTQFIAAPPAGLRFTASIWLKAGAPLDVTLALTDGQAESVAAQAAVGPAWKRFSLSGTFSSGNGAAHTGFRFEMPAFAAVSVFGAQLMALEAPGAYVRTTNVSGFHPRCRFGSDVLAHRLAGPGYNDLRLSIVEFA